MALKAWMYGLRLSPRGWWGTMHTYLLEIGFVSSTADPCVYNLDYGAVFLLYLDDILLSGSDDENVLQADRLETVDVGDAKFLLGMGIHRNVHAGTIILPQETYDRTIQETYEMADARLTKTPAEAGPMHIEEDGNFCQQRTPPYSSVPRDLFFILAGAQGRISRMQYWYLREACQNQVRER